MWAQPFARTARAVGGSLEEVRVVDNVSVR
jgi:hypothetical protein